MCMNRNICINVSNNARHLFQIASTIKWNDPLQTLCKVMYNRQFNVSTFRSQYFSLSNPLRMMRINVTKIEVFTRDVNFANIEIEIYGVRNMLVVKSFNWPDTPFILVKIKWHDHRNYFHLIIKLFAKLRLFILLIKSIFIFSQDSKISIFIHT